MRSRCSIRKCAIAWDKNLNREVSFREMEFRSNYMRMYFKHAFTVTGNANRWSKPVERRWRYRFYFQLLCNLRRRHTQNPNIWFLYLHWLVNLQKSHFKPIRMICPRHGCKLSTKSGVGMMSLRFDQTNFKLTLLKTSQTKASTFQNVLILDFLRY